MTQSPDGEGEGSVLINVPVAVVAALLEDVNQPTVGVILAGSPTALKVIGGVPVAAESMLLTSIGGSVALNVATTVAAPEGIVNVRVLPVPPVAIAPAGPVTVTVSTIKPESGERLIVTVLVSGAVAGTSIVPPVPETLLVILCEGGVKNSRFANSILNVPVTTT